jgi:tetratricopeptide (TPR) repeat protein
VPVIGLVQIGTHGRADRFTYVSLIGIFMMIAWLGADLAQRWQVSGRLQRTRLMQALAIAVVILLAVAGWAQTRYWRDSITLYEHSLAGNAGGPKLHYNLGLAYSQRGDHRQALPHYRQTIGLKPDHAKAWNNLGNSLRLLENHGEAEQAFQRALALDADFPLAHANYSLLLGQTGRLEEAITQRRLALNLQPDDATGHNHLGTLLAQTGRLEEAVTHFQQAVRLNPRDRDARWNLTQTEKLLQSSSGDGSE